MIVLHTEWTALLVCNPDTLLYLVGLYEPNKAITTCMRGAWTVGYDTACSPLPSASHWTRGGPG